MAVVGCGALARQFLVPVLAGHDQIELSALVDPDRARVRELACQYAVPHICGDASELAPGLVEAALVATPPGLHARAAVELVRRGIHVLVEKPLTRDPLEAEALLHDADRAGVLVAAGYFRRLFHSTRLLRAFLDDQFLGKPLAFDVEEGSSYGWPLATLGNLSKEHGGGGVLIDIGSHLIDQLAAVFRSPPRLNDYQDNSLGGVETDCRLELAFIHGGAEVAGHIELSRTRTLRNSVRIDCARGTLELVAGDRYHVRVLPRAAQARTASLLVSWDGVEQLPGWAAYRLEIDHWLAAIRGEQPLEIDARSVLPTVRLIDTAYQQARPMPASWEAPRVPRGEPASARSRHERVLITGATGFIGCRLAEILHREEDYDVRALVHRPASAARLARLPVEMVVGDLRNPSDVQRALQGCAAVVHCAVGKSWQSRREVFADTVTGTHNLARSALKAGVRRFIHLSTIAVHGADVPAVIDETTPIRPPPGSLYAQSKVAAERVIQRFAARGLPAVTLRPAHVYGPHGFTFVVNPIAHLARGTLLLVGADAPSNTLYVDNLAEAILRALQAGESIHGETITLAAEDDLTWVDFYGFFASALGTSPRCATRAEYAALHQGESRPGWLHSAWHGFKGIVTSQELRSLGRKIYQTDPYGVLPRWFLERFPRVRERLRRLAGLETPACYRLLPGAPAEKDLVMDGLPAVIRMDKARRLLGYEPRVARAEAMQRTLDWLRFQRMIP